MQSTVPATISIRYFKNVIGKVVFSSVRNLKLPHTVSFVSRAFFSFTKIAPRGLWKRPFFFLFVLFFNVYVCFLLVFCKQIKIPVLLLNALDDPLVPEELFITPYNHVSEY